MKEIFSDADREAFKQSSHKFSLNILQGKSGKIGIQPHRPGSQVKRQRRQAAGSNKQAKTMGMSCLQCGESSRDRSCMMAVRSTGQRLFRSGFYRIMPWYSSVFLEHTCKTGWTRSRNDRSASSGTLGTFVTLARTLGSSAGQGELRLDMRV